MNNCNYNILPPINSINTGFNKLVDDIRNVLVWRENPDDPLNVDANLGLEWITTLYGIADRQPDLNAQNQAFGSFPYVRVGAKQYERVTTDTNEPCVIFFFKTSPETQNSANDVIYTVNFSIIGFVNLDLIRSDLPNDYTRNLVTQIRDYIERNKASLSARPILNRFWVNNSLNQILPEFDQISIERMNLMHPRHAFRLDYTVIIEDDCIIDNRTRIDLTNCPV